VSEEYEEYMSTPIFSVHQWKRIDEHPLHLDNELVIIEKGGNLFENTKVIKKEENKYTSFK
jgi:hypothetical protein